MEIRRSYNRLISTMGFPILVRWHLYIESRPRFLNKHMIPKSLCCSWLQNGCHNEGNQHNYCRLSCLLTAADPGARLTQQTLDKMATKLQMKTYAVSSWKLTPQFVHWSFFVFFWGGGGDWCEVIIGLENVLVSNSWQAIIWTHDNSVHQG